MRKKNKPSAKDTEEQFTARINHCLAQLAIAEEALRHILALDDSCHYGRGKCGFQLAGYVARMALEKLNH